MRQMPSVNGNNRTLITNLSFVTKALNTALDQLADFDGVELHKLLKLFQYLNSRPTRA